MTCDRTCLLCVHVRVCMQRQSVTENRITNMTHLNIKENHLQNTRAHTEARRVAGYNLWLNHDRQARLLLPLGQNMHVQLWTLNFIAGCSITGLAPGVTAPASHAETEPDADGSSVGTRALIQEAHSSSGTAALGTSLPITWLTAAQSGSWFFFFFTAISSREMQHALWLASSLEP